MDSSSLWHAVFQGPIPSGYSRIRSSFINKSPVHWSPRSGGKGGGGTPQESSFGHAPCHLSRSSLPRIMEKLVWSTRITEIKPWFSHGFPIYFSSIFDHEKTMFPLCISRIIWLVVQQPSWKIWVRQWGWDDIPFILWKIIQSCLKPPTSYPWLSIIVQYHPFLSMISQMIFPLIFPFSVAEPSHGHPACSWSWRPKALVGTFTVLGATRGYEIPIRWDIKPITMVTL